MRVTQWAAALGVARAIDFAYGADIPLAVDTNVAKMVALEARFMIARVVTGEWSIDRYAMDSPRGIDLMTEFNAL